VAAISNVIIQQIESGMMKYWFLMVWTWKGCVNFYFLALIFDFLFNLKMLI